MTDNPVMVSLPTFLAQFADLPALLAAIMAGYDRFGYALVFLGAFLEHSILLGVIVPGGTMVSFGGAAARLGTLQLPANIAIAAAGMVCGACMDYWLGRAGLIRIVLGSRFGARLRPGLERATAYLDRHGWWAISLVHALGAGRSAVAVTAGACRMTFWKFALCEIPAAILWSAFFNLLGYGVATNLADVQRNLSRLVLLVVLVAGAALFSRWLRRRAQARVAASAGDR